MTTASTSVLTQPLLAFCLCFSRPSLRLALALLYYMDDRRGVRGELIRDDLHLPEELTGFRLRPASLPTPERTRSSIWLSKPT